MKSKSQRWVEAGKVLAEDPTARVSCPRCENSTLEVEDVRNPNTLEELERIMSCGECGAMNVLRLRRPAKT